MLSLCGSENEIQDFLLAEQTFYQLGYIYSLSFYSFCEIKKMPILLLLIPHVLAALYWLLLLHTFYRGGN